MQRETERILNVYKNRKIESDPMYMRTRPEIALAIQERHRALIDFLGDLPLDELKILEVGCGDGSNLLELVLLGCNPSNLTGNDIRGDVLELAAARLPASIVLKQGDAVNLEQYDEYFDIVYQSTVFSSILSLEVQKELAKKMWSWLKPGGAILWYDFVYNNPKNENVKGVPIKTVEQLFPYGHAKVKRLTLAPPISRKLVKFHPSLYNLFNLIPVLRTHRMCLIKKPDFNQSNSK